MGIYYDKPCIVVVFGEGNVKFKARPFIGTNINGEKEEAIVFSINSIEDDECIGVDDKTYTNEVIRLIFKDAKGLDGVIDMLVKAKEALTEAQKEVKNDK